jgi:F-type H+-transporting ATPase subunit delta
MQGPSRDSLARLRESLTELTADAASAALRELSEQLFAVVTLLSSQRSLRQSLSDPGLDAEQRAVVVDNLLRSHLSPPAMQLVRAAVQLRWSEPRDLVDALEALAVEAALQQAEVDGVLDEVEDELFRFMRIVDAQPELRRALTDQNLPLEAKRELLRRLLDGKVAASSMELIERAVTAPRGRTIERVLDEFTDLAARRRERLIARVTSAVALTDGQQERLREALRREFGRDVRLQIAVDPALVGGFTVRVGDELIDASVLRNLDAARRRLTGRSGAR